MAPDTDLPDPAAWPPVTRETRPWTRWWWPASAVEAGDLRRQLDRMDEVGIGGVEVTPIYGVEGEEHRFLEHLSPEWLARFEGAAREARDRGMGVDMVPGTGWHFGGPAVPERDAVAELDAEVIDPDAAPVELSVDPDSAATVVADGPDGRTVDLTDRIDGAGDLEWHPPDGPEGWRVVAVSVGPGPDAGVKRASPDREGPMINPYLPGAMERHLRRFDEGFAGYDGPPLRATFHDSFEYPANWSPALLEAFEERRGYRLQDHLPALLGEADDEAVARVRADYRRTLSALYEASISRWCRWSHRHGWSARFQAHCAPGNILDLYALADIPETEFILDRRNALGAEMASSAAHVEGADLVSAETATWLGEHFTVSLAEIKAHLDRLFLAGVNHVVYHGTCYAPEDAPWPGWLFYAATQLNPRNPVWRDLGTLNAYVTRCQSVLQHGEPDADVLLYWPVEDVWHREDGLADRLPILDREWFESYPFGRLARRLREAGYAVDYVSDRQLRTATVNDGALSLPGGEYRVVLFPDTDHAPVETLRSVLALAADGATVGFQALPGDVPGMAALEDRRAELGALLDDLDLSRAEGLRVADHGDGQVLVGDPGTVLSRTDARREPLVDAGLAFERRAFDGGRHYFLVNTAEESLDRWVPFAADAGAVVLLDPMADETHTAAWRPADDAGAGIEVRLRLAPGESVVVRTLSGVETDASPTGYWTAAGEPSTVEGPWRVEFLRGGPERPPPVETEELDSWTAFGGLHRRFAGTARYTTTVDRPADGEDWWLDLGTVHESARVWLDGRDLGTVVDPPYRLPVGDLAPADATLRVEVTSLAANRVRDLDRRNVAWKHFGDINLVGRDYEPFDAAEWDVRPAGLLGPVRFVPRRPD
ncbi:MAG: glycosyl hydrolase [Halobacteriales archaeon]